MGRAGRRAGGQVKGKRKRRDRFLRSRYLCFIQSLWLVAGTRRQIKSPFSQIAKIAKIASAASPAAPGARISCCTQLRDNVCLVYTPTNQLTNQPCAMLLQRNTNHDAHHAVVKKGPCIYNIHDILFKLRRVPAPSPSAVGFALATCYLVRPLSRSPQHAKISKPSKEKRESILVKQRHGPDPVRPVPSSHA